MATLSTLNAPPPAKPAAKPPGLISVQDIWNKYFAARHSEVLADATQAMFAANTPDYLHVGGLSLLASGRPGDGIALLRVALLLYPQAPSWFANGAIALLNAGLAQEA